MKNYKISIIGLGYVGLPLAVEFGKKYDVLGYDINLERIEELKKGFDRTGESNAKEIKSSTGLKFSTFEDDISDSNIYIITVPTPINKHKAPDLNPLMKSSELVGRFLSKGDIVIYESTVYPGCTEEDCVPILEKFSKLKYNSDFFCGYSPERINPGDKVNTLVNIRKVTSGSNAHVSKIVDDLYKSIIVAGTYKAKSIMVAEASKAIENAQRDLNISFVNELALIFDRLGIDTTDVIEAAASKWNFLKYKPGLVGGHCIGVDPHYLVHKAKSLGYHPEVIMSGRRVNDEMGLFVANKVIKMMIAKGQKVLGNKALILGFTFKENCGDIRNTKVIDIYNELKQFGMEVDVLDPHANKNEVKDEYQILIKERLETKYDAIILAVSHDEFLKIDFSKIIKPKRTIVFDTKSFLPKKIVDCRL